MKPKRCDFCSAWRPKWVYPVRAFSIPDVSERPHRFEAGVWAACDICHSFVEGGDAQGLTLRMYSRMGPPEVLPGIGAPTWLLRSHVRDLLEGFQSARQGPAVRNSGRNVRNLLQ